MWRLLQVRYHKWTLIRGVARNAPDPSKVVTTPHLHGPDGVYVGVLAYAVQAGRLKIGASPRPAEGQTALP